MDGTLGMVIVFGCVKSATSATAAILEAHGVFFGRTAPGSNTNPDGSWEHPALMDLFGRYVARIGGGSGPRRNRGFGWEFLAGLYPWHNDGGLPPIPFLRERVLATLRRDGWDGKSPIGVKIPDIAFLARLWHEAFPEARWVWVRRDPAEVKESVWNIERARGNLSERRRAELEDWVDSFEEACRHVAQRLPVLECRTADVARTGDWSGVRAAVEGCGLAWDPAAAERVFRPELLTRGNRLRAPGRMPEQWFPEERLIDRARENAGKGNAEQVLHPCTAAAAAALREIVSLVELPLAGQGHQWGYLSNFLHSARQPVDPAAARRWMEDEEHGFFHGLMAAATLWMLHRRRNLFLHPDDLVAILHHDFHRAATGEERDHDRRLAAWFDGLPRWAYAHSARRGGDLPLGILADRIELLRYADHAEWVDRGMIDPHLAPDEREWFDWFHAAVRPMLLRLYRAARDNALLLCHGIEGGPCTCGEVDLASDLFPRPNEHMALTPGGCYGVHLFEPHEVAARIASWTGRSSQVLSWDRLKGLVEAERAQDMGVRPLAYREHAGAANPLPRRDWIFLLHRYEEREGDDILARIAADGNILPAKAFEALCTLVSRYRAFLRLFAGSPAAAPALPLQRLPDAAVRAAAGH